jgi:putative transposase
MARTILPQAELLDNHDLLGAPTDDLRDLLSMVLHRVMEMDVTRLSGAEPYERVETRSNQRNGTRPRRFDTRMGTIALEVPRLRSGGYQPAFLEHRSRSERALIALVQEAFVGGMSTRKIEKLVAELGVASLSKSQVSEFCKDLDESVLAFRTRPLTARYPYVMLDAVYEKIRIDRTIASQAVVVAYGVREDGVRELLGLDVVDTESYESWSTFMRELQQRGLHGVKLLVSDAHAGLVKAIETVFVGASWQRCKVHFFRNVLAYAPQRLKGELAGAIKGIFAQTTRDSARARLREVLERYGLSCVKAMQILDTGVEDALTYLDFPEVHWRKICTTNPIERINREIRRRTKVVGIFPSVDSALRLIGMILLEQTEDWQTEKRYMSPEFLSPLYANEELSKT